MTRIRRILLSVSLAVPFILGSGEALAQRRHVRAAVYNLGTANDSDRESAKAQAKDNAENGIVCIGQLDDLRTTVSCVKMGDGENEQWLCTANSTGICIVGG
jgi:hypothetical protein